MRAIVIVVFVLVATNYPLGSSLADFEQEGRSVISQDVLDHQKANDLAVIQALKAAGSDLSKPHALEHHFNSASRALADPVLAWGRAAGYKPSKVSDGEFEGRRYVYFDLVKETVPTLANITPQTTAMLEVAAKHGLEYDGWGCEVVK